MNILSAIKKSWHKLKTVFNRDIPTTRFALYLGLLNLILFHFPFFNYIIRNTDFTILSSIVFTTCILLAVLVANAFLFYLILSVSRVAGKFFLVLFFLLNAISLYFIRTYNVFMDLNIIESVFNSKQDEATVFVTFKLVLYFILLGVVPAIYIIKKRVVGVKWKKFLTTSSLTLLFLCFLVIANAGNREWFRENNKQLEGLMIPWSYSINTARYFSQKKHSNSEILLPDLTLLDNEKSVVVLVIGESARLKNFSLFGYEKETNPLLSQTENLHIFPATSCATFTTATLKCILKHNDGNGVEEILPNYLYRNDVDVIWRTTNSGEPPILIENYMTRDSLLPYYEGKNPDYDEILLANLKEQIASSKKNKILVVLHTGTSHGPNYSKKYPSHFEIFNPVCNNADPSKCSREELINAYDNTIVYTDYMLHTIIEELKQLGEYNSAMIYVSDHGESLGEENKYMHGLPMNIAPAEQYEIPFIVWLSDSTTTVKPYKELTQGNVFHSILNFLHIDSPIYNEERNIFVRN